RTARRRQGVRRAGDRLRAVPGHGVRDPAARPGTAGAVQAGTPPGVRRTAEDDLREDPARGVARSGGRARRARLVRVLGGGLPGAEGAVALRARPRPRPPAGWRPPSRPPTAGLEDLP